MGEGASRIKPIKVYVAGPLMQNTRPAIEAAEALFQQGFIPFIPHTMHTPWHENHPKAWEVWVALDLHWLETCDAMLRLPGESKGADREEAFANANCIPVFQYIDPLVAYFLTLLQKVKPEKLGLFIGGCARIRGTHIVRGIASCAKDDNDRLIYNLFDANGFFAEELEAVETPADGGGKVESTGLLGAAVSVVDKNSPFFNYEGSLREIECESYRVDFGDGTAWFTWEQLELIN